jgi:hypothetical protein
MRLNATHLASIAQARGFGDRLWDLAGMPSLSLQFAATQSLIDLVSGQNLITFSRLSDGTTTNSAGQVQTVAAGIPRFTHDPVTLECLGLLPEEQKANLTLWSEEFDNAAWVKARASITPNATASPRGTITADKLVEDNTANNTHVAVQVFTFAATTYTLSIFANAAERSWVRLFAFDGVTNFGCYFNLSAGTVGTAVASTGFIRPLADGWFRCAMTFTAAAGTGTYAARLATGDGADVYTGNGTSGLFVWGAQLETGGLTSYIPTGASSVVRSADVATITGTNFSSWYRQDGGSMLASASVLSPAAFTGRVYSINDNTLNNRIEVFRQADFQPAYRVISGGADQAQLGLGAIWNTSGIVGTAAAYSANDFAVSANSSNVQTDSSGSIPTVNQINIGSLPGTSYLNGPIARLDYWPRRLPNSVLQEMSR